MWAHSPDNHGRGAQLKFYDARDSVSGYLDADAALTGMLTVRPELLHGYAAAGTATIHMWIEVGGARFGGFAHRQTATHPSVLGVFQFPFNMPIPDALDGTPLNDLSVGVEFSGVQHGFAGVRGAGQSWIDFPVQDGPSRAQVSPSRDCSSGATLSPQMSSTSLTIPAAPDTDPTVNRTWDFEVLVDAGSTAMVVDLTATWDNAEVDVHLFAGDHGSSQLSQPIEYGPEYLATVVEGCTVIPVTLMVPGVGNSVVARDLTVQLTADFGEPEWPSLLTDKPLDEPPV